MPRCSRMAEDQTRYASLGGKPSARQTGLLQATVARLPEGAEIVAAFDADEAGRKAPPAPQEEPELRAVVQRAIGEAQCFADKYDSAVWFTLMEPKLRR